MIFSKTVCFHPKKRHSLSSGWYVVMKTSNQKSVTFYYINVLIRFGAILMFVNVTTYDCNFAALLKDVLNTTCTYSTCCTVKSKYRP